MPLLGNLRYVFSVVALTATTAAVLAAAKSGAPGSVKWFAAIPDVSATTAFGLPAFGANDLTFVCANNAVYALQISDGNQAWAFTTDNACQYIDVAETSIVVATNSSVYALSIYSGYQLWRYQFGNPSPSVPARPTIAGRYVFFTVENGPQSTPMQVLDLASGTLVYSDPVNVIATTRLWFLRDLHALVYVQINTQNTTANSQQLVMRSARSPFAYIWTQSSPSTQLSLAYGGGTVAFRSDAILAMTIDAATSANGIAAIDPTTGNVSWQALQWSQTNNFDYSSSYEKLSWNGNAPVAMTLESWGPPGFAQSAMTAYSAADGTQLWQTNFTAGVPDLLPAGPERFLAVGNSSIVGLQLSDGAITYTIDFPNLVQNIGNSAWVGGQWVFVVGNSPQGGVYCYFA